MVDAVPPARVLDTTGAGDLYAAGFLRGLTMGLDLAACGRLGSACAAEIIAQYGARAGTAAAAAHGRGCSGLDAAFQRVQAVGARCRCRLRRQGSAGVARLVVSPVALPWRCAAFPAQLSEVGKAIDCRGVAERYFSIVQLALWVTMNAWRPLAVL